MLPEGYYVRKSEDGSTWYLRSAEPVYNAHNAMIGDRSVASGPANPREVAQFERIAWLDHKIRSSDTLPEDLPRELAGLFPTPLLPADPLLDEKGRQIRREQGYVRS